MPKASKFNFWGDPELDQLWRQMYEIEISMDDMDLAEDSPKLKRWESVNALFKRRMEIIDKRKT